MGQDIESYFEYYGFGKDVYRILQFEALAVTGSERVWVCTCLYYDYGKLAWHFQFMRVKQYHKSAVTGNGWNPTYFCSFRVYQHYSNQYLFD